MTRFPAQSVGVEPTGNVHEMAARQMGGRLRVVYEHHEFDVPASWTNPTDINATTAGYPHDATPSCSCGRQAGAFNLMDKAQRIIIRNMGTAPIKVRFNGAANDLFTVDDGEYLDWEMVEVESIYLENDSATLVPVRIAIV